jgi:hypothetical protein
MSGMGQEIEILEVVGCMESGENNNWWVQRLLKRKIY